MYHKTQYFATKWNILPQSVVLLWTSCTTTNCSILLHCILVYHKIQYFTRKCDIITQCVTYKFYYRVWYFTWYFTIDIVPQSVVFLLESVCAFPMSYPKTICSIIVLQNMLSKHKDSIRLKCNIFYKYIR